MEKKCLAMSHALPETFNSRIHTCNFIFLLTLCKRRVQHDFLYTYQTRYRCAERTRKSVTASPLIPLMSGLMVEEETAKKYAPEIEPEM